MTLTAFKLKLKSFPSMSYNETHDSILSLPVMIIDLWFMPLTFRCMDKTNLVSDGYDQIDHKYNHKAETVLNIKLH